MTTHLAVTLSEKYSEWSTIFKLQSESDFASALACLKNAPIPDSQVGIYMQFVKINLELSISVKSGSMPKEEYASRIRLLVGEAQSLNAFDIQVELFLLMFDVFAIYREEAYTNLCILESSMDEHTLRRWIHRKGMGLVHLGQLFEALDLWQPFVSAKGDSFEDFDDSLAVLLLDFGRVCSLVGKYSDAVEVYNQSLCVSKTVYNQCMSLIRLSNALERMARPAQADKRRIEYFSLIKKEYPTKCSLCSGPFGKEPKFLIPCCKTVVHAECLRSDILTDSASECPFCKVSFFMGDVLDPTMVSGRKYKRHKPSSRVKKGQTDVQEPTDQTDPPDESNRDELVEE